jgi:restriction endonuclease-like protein
MSPVIRAADVTQGLAASLRKDLVRNLRKAAGRGTPSVLAPVPAEREPESPVERMFRDAWRELYPQDASLLIPQYEVRAGGCRFRLDFALSGLDRFGIEIDGHATHSSPAAIAADRRRQRILERAGWHIIRFGGAEVYADARECAREARELARLSGRRWAGRPPR